MGLALLWALLLGVPGAPAPWSDDVGLPGYDLSFIPWNDEEPQFRERAVKVYHLSPDLGRLDGGEGGGEQRGGVVEPTAPVYDEQARMAELNAACTACVKALSAAVYDPRR